MAAMLDAANAAAASAWMAFMETSPG